LKRQPVGRPRINSDRGRFPDAGVSKFEYNINQEKHMQEQSNKNNEQKAPACISTIGVSRCRCGAYHLRYRYVDVAIPRETLYLIMEECFRYEEECAKREGQRPEAMVFSLGVVTLAILPLDFAAFSKAVGDAVNEDLGIGRLFAGAEAGDNGLADGTQN
jgi:hypothetical protein